MWPFIANMCWLQSDESWKPFPTQGETRHVRIKPFAPFACTGSDARCMLYERRELAGAGRSRRQPTGKAWSPQMRAGARGSSEVESSEWRQKAATGADFSN